MKITDPLVSVVMTVKNVQSTIVGCLRSILSQTFEDFEIVLIDDYSTDQTANLIRALDDKRIKYFKNEKWLGITPSRNRGIQRASGNFIFFIDGDCTASKNWIKAGLKYLELADCIGVEGRIFYVSEDYKPTFSDHVMENRHGGNFMTGNMAYKRDVLVKVGGFDDRLTYLEDRDIAFRVMEYGKIYFSLEMIVYHPRVTLTPRALIKSSKNVKNRVLVYKKLHKKDFIAWRVLYPINLLQVLCPPLIFSSLFSKRFIGPADFNIVPFMYVYLVFQRLRLWEACARERVFLI